MRYVRSGKDLLVYGTDSDAVAIHAKVLAESEQTGQTMSEIARKMVVALDLRIKRCGAAVPFKLQRTRNCYARLM